MFSGSGSTHITIPGRVADVGSAAQNRSPRAAAWFLPPETIFISNAGNFLF